MDSEYQEVYDEFVALFSYSPPLVRLAEDSDVTFSENPNMFYDRHLDPRLSLKHIKHASSLPLEIAGLVLNELRFLKDRGQLLPLIENESEDGCRFSTVECRESLTPPEPLEDARSVARFYSKSSFRNCASIALTIALHPQAETWLTFVDFCEGSEPDRDQCLPVVNDYILRIYHNPRTGELRVPNSIWSCISDALRRDLRLASDRFRTLATFQFHAPLAPVKKLFKNMGIRLKEGRVPLLHNSVQDYVTQQINSSFSHPDSSRSLNSLPSIEAICSSMQTVRRSVRLSSRAERRPKTTESKSLRDQNTWPTLCVQKPTATKSISTLYVQQAWTRAVESDSTIIVFNCGNYERIGFRHRDSQTLCLSDLIDVSETSDPGYGQLQVGLYMVILRDALDRIRLMNVRSTGVRPEMKRKLSDDVENSAANKKPRLATTTEQEDDNSTESVTTFASCWESMEYLILHHPWPLYRIHRTAPSRVSAKTSGNKRKRQFTPKEYFRITLTSKIAEGVTGKVHDAKIEVQTGDGRVHKCLGVVKIALDYRKRQKLRHEYAVYHYMALKKVKGIATVYGLFEDAANEAMLLVMSHTGTSLVKQPHYQERGEVKLSDKEKDAFKAVMAEIHEAGVRHYDIRPENLMMDQDGRAAIIDFDMAKVKAGKRSRRREHTIYAPFSMVVMTLLINGKVLELRYLQDLLLRTTMSWKDA
ncbi:hypothetical protein APHAL10511_007799 [Amanita phalloides]|nr:hypothetical protein APHAL10511_007799 [Amanita phalloides]